jgi:hypothetical protein
MRNGDQYVMLQVLVVEIGYQSCLLVMTHGGNGSVGDHTIAVLWLQLLLSFREFCVRISGLIADYRDWNFVIFSDTLGKHRVCVLK